MRIRRFSAALAALAALTPWAALAQAPGPAGPSRPDLRVSPQHAGETRCEKCHTTEAWDDVSFAHERTGFPLRGRHARAGCKGCHPASFQAPVPRSCEACHRDVHAGQLGARCQGCHEETSWRSRFDADAHRRSNFPLTGRHAFLPCEECHGDRRDRGFARATKTCLDCHDADYQRTRGSALDHVAAGFPADCRNCHRPWRWSGAFFATHERCFPIASGAHAGIRCLNCHTSLQGIASPGTCSTLTAACTRCHTSASTTPRHGGVPGYQWTDRKCYECHAFGRATGGLSGAPGRRP